MKRRKSVGAGGFSVELLFEADAHVQRASFDIMMEDVALGRVADDWHRVLYALLRKPAPNNPDLVGERREIALMAQEMKILLKMVRRACHDRLTDRLISSQMGWLRGFGFSDPGMAATFVVQQSARLKTELWLLYIDLATMFPKINREISSLASMVHGLPKEVQDLVGLIYGESKHASKVRCQYETEVGLGAPFDNWMGSLMGFCLLLRLSLCWTQSWSPSIWSSRVSGSSDTSLTTWRRCGGRSARSLLPTTGWAPCARLRRYARSGVCGLRGKSSRVAS